VLVIAEDFAHSGAFEYMVVGSSAERAHAQERAFLQAFQAATAA
jgi:hypothetical protein